MPASRRRFLGAITAGLAVPVCARGQSQRRPQIGFVDNTIPLSQLVDTVGRDPNTQAFVGALSDLGWKEQQSVEILWRSVEGDFARRPGIFEELVRRRVDVIVVFGDFATREALQKTRTVPIVMVTSSNPIHLGFAASLARPGGNVTGLASDVEGLFGKRLELLKRAAPAVTRVGLFVLASEASRLGQIVPPEAAKLGLTIVPIAYDGMDSAVVGFAEAVRLGANGLYFAPSSVLNDPKNHATIRALIVKYRLPAVVSGAGGSVLGAVVGYGPDFRSLHVTAASYVDRILRGAKPAELPIEQPTIFRLVVNRGAARAIGLVIPAAMIAEADQVND